MFDHTSRYYLLANRIHGTAGERQTAYKERRFLPQGETLPLLAEVTVAQSDRLDLVAARTLGQPELFWRVADANNAMDPFELTSTAGARLRVPLPQAEAGSRPGP